MDLLKLRDILDSVLDLEILTKTNFHEELKNATKSNTDLLHYAMGRQNYQVQQGTSGERFQSSFRGGDEAGIVRNYQESHRSLNFLKEEGQVFLVVETPEYYNAFNSNLQFLISIRSNNDLRPYFTDHLWNEMSEFLISYRTISSTGFIELHEYLECTECVDLIVLVRFSVELVTATRANIGLLKSIWNREATKEFLTEDQRGLLNYFLQHLDLWNDLQLYSKTYLMLNCLKKDEIINLVSLSPEFQMALGSNLLLLKRITEQRLAGLYFTDDNWKQILLFLETFPSRASESELKKTNIPHVLEAPHKFKSLKTRTVMSTVYKDIQLNVSDSSDSLSSSSEDLSSLSSDDDNGRRMNIQIPNLHPPIHFVSKTKHDLQQQQTVFTTWK